VARRNSDLSRETITEEPMALL